MVTRSPSKAVSESHTKWLIQSEKKNPLKRSTGEPPNNTCPELPSVSETICSAVRAPDHFALMGELQIHHRER